MNKKLSELIREGAEERPQAYGYLFVYNEYFGETNSCVIGAALEAFFGTIDVDEIEAAIASDLTKPDGMEYFDEYIAYITQTPQHLVDEAIRMNDGGLTARTTIAKWLEEQGY